MDQKIGMMYLALSDFEREIIDTQIVRMYAAREVYGPWVKGSKNLTREAIEELLDAMQYMTAKLLETEDVTEKN